MNPARGSSSSNTCAFYRWVRGFGKTRDKILAFHIIFCERVMYSPCTSRLMDFISSKKRRKESKNTYRHPMSTLLANQPDGTTRCKENYTVADHVLHTNIRYVDAFSENRKWEDSFEGNTYSLQINIFVQYILNKKAIIV